jgi:hypothetical protein
MRICLMASGCQYNFLQAGLLILIYDRYLIGLNWLIDYLDANNICTLLLYKEFVEWKTHYVLSKDYVAIFDLDKETLVVMTRKECEKLSNDTTGK